MIVKCCQFNHFSPFLTFALVSIQKPSFHFLANSFFSSTPSLFSSLNPNGKYSKDLIYFILFIHWCDFFLKIVLTESNLNWTVFVCLSHFWPVNAYIFKWKYVRINCSYIYFVLFVTECIWLDYIEFFLCYCNRPPVFSNV